jgi:predicted Zn finger-like uncharacterized protein
VSSLITICPQCQTGFRVTPEQLAARQGLVRCGSCAAVFNGFAALQKSAELSPEPESETREASGPTASPLNDLATGAHDMPRGDAAFSEGPSIPAAQAGVSDEEAGAATSSDAPPESSATPASGDETSDADEDAWPIIEPLEGELLPLQSRGPASSGGGLERPKEIEWPAIMLDVEPSSPSAALPFPTAKAPIETSAASDPEWKPKRGGQAAAPATVDDELLEYEPELLLPLPQPARKRPRWRVLAAVLWAVLVLQGALLFRNDIIGGWPEAYSGIHSICARLGCSVALPRQIEHITIESSELRADPDHPNVIVLTALLRSRAALPLQYPWLEVSLTDTLDIPVARRSLAPKDYLPKPPGDEEGMGAGSELTIKAAFESAEAKASGYKLRLYYP